MHLPDLLTPRGRRSAGIALGLTLLVASAPSLAMAALSGVGNSTTGASCSGGGSSDGDCRNSVAFSTPSNGTTFTSRYAWNVNADVGVASTHDTSGTAKHNVSFTATAPGGYRVQIGTTRVGEIAEPRELLIELLGRAFRLRAAGAREPGGSELRSSSSKRSWAMIGTVEPVDSSIRRLST